MSLLAKNMECACAKKFFTQHPRQRIIIIIISHVFLHNTLIAGDSRTHFMRCLALKSVAVSIFTSTQNTGETRNANLFPVSREASVMKSNSWCQELF